MKILIPVFCLLLWSSLASAKPLKIISRELPKSYSEVTSPKFPDYKCTYRMSENEYLLHCKDKSRNIDYAVEIKFRWTTCYHQGTPAICLYFDKATAHGPNGDNSWLGGNFNVSTRHGGQKRIWIPSEGFVTSRTYDIRPSGPFVFKYSNPKYTERKSRITIKAPGKLKLVFNFEGFGNPNSVNSSLTGKSYELKKGAVVVEEKKSDCLDLRKKLHRRLSSLKSEEANYDKKFNKFKELYEASKVELRTEYPQTKWTLTYPLPFLNDVGIEKATTVTGGQQYLPDIVITNPATNRSKFISLLSELEKIPRISSKVGDLKKIYSMLTKKNIGYYEGMERHKTYMKRRFALLQRYSNSITEYYCQNVLPVKSDILVIRDRELKESQCSAMERQVLITDVTRGSDIRNSEHLIRAEDYCRDFAKKKTMGKKKKRNDVASKPPSQTFRTEEEKNKALLKDLLKMYNASKN